MSFFLRVTGIMNAAVWFGTAVFFTVAVWPGFFSPEMLKILPRSHSGAAAAVMLQRFCVLQYWCGMIALGHFLLEWLYAGKTLRRWVVLWMAGLFAVALFSGMVVQPRTAQRHLELYGMRSTPQQRQQAARSLPVWHGLVQGTNTIMVLGLGAYLWVSTNAGAGARSLRRPQTEGLTNRVW